MPWNFTVSDNYLIRHSLTWKLLLADILNWKWNDKELTNWFIQFLNRGKILTLISKSKIYFQAFFLNSRHHGSENESDNNEIEYKYKPDVYFVVGAVSFIILLVLCVAIYKAFVMLKISLNDGIDDTVPVGQNNQRSQNQENVQSVASGQFINGKF